MRRLLRDRLRSEGPCTHRAAWGSTQELLGRLIPLNLGAQVLDSVQSDESTAPDAEGNASEARTLKLLLAINGAMFVFELIVG